MKSHYPLLIVTSVDATPSAPVGATASAPISAAVDAMGSTISTGSLGDDALMFVGTYGGRMVGVLAVVAVAFLASKWLGQLIRSSCDRGGVDATLAHFCSKLVHWTILLIAGILILNQCGVDTASFAVVLGTVGLAIGLAFQSTLSNFAAGVMLMVFRPYKIGDAITVAGQSGVVDEIDLFSTTLDTADRRRIFVPNSSIFGSVITNTSTHAIRRADVNVRVDYRADIDATRSALMGAAIATAGRVADDPDIGLMELGAQGVEWQARVWCKNSDYLAVRQALVREVKSALDRAGIGIAAPWIDPGAAPR
ncbi:MAG: mechanosensitive ion channel family protein [Phycisphaerales bacterium]|nr:mechanosensitive ion channel family protein [Phycisphaerales bacterium]